MQFCVHKITKSIIIIMKLVKLFTAISSILADAKKTNGNSFKVLSFYSSKYTSLSLSNIDDQKVNEKRLNSNGLCLQSCTNANENDDPVPPLSTRVCIHID